MDGQHPELESSRFLPCPWDVTVCLQQDSINSLLQSLQTLPIGISLIYHYSHRGMWSLFLHGARWRLSDFLPFLSLGNYCLTAYVVRDTLQPFHSFLLISMHPSQPPSPWTGEPPRSLPPILRDSLFSFLSTEYCLLFPTWLSILSSWYLSLPIDYQLLILFDSLIHSLS